VSEYVVPLDVMVRCDAIAPRAEIAGPASGRTALAVAPHPDDQDQRCVVLLWTGVRSMTSSDPRAPLSRHRLYDNGLGDVAWVGVVRRRDQPSVDGAVHHVVLLDDRAVEVVAELLTVHRVSGSTATAAAAALEL
jgi:hypothetical protein